MADPLIDPPTLARAVELGILDAPQLRNNRFARGEAITRIIDGAVRVSQSIRPDSLLSEAEPVSPIF